jgi:hypothetical protein
VYEHSLGTEAEKFGPLSIQVEDRLRGLDEDLSYFMDRLRKANMEDMVNIVLVKTAFIAHAPDYLCTLKNEFLRHLVQITYLHTTYVYTHIEKTSL